MSGEKPTKTARKTKISLTLRAPEAELLDEAVRLACLLRGAGDEPTHSNRRFVLGWMIVAVSSAIIRRGSMPQMLAVDMRDETSEETRQRVALLHDGAGVASLRNGTSTAAAATAGQPPELCALFQLADGIRQKYYRDLKDRPATPADYTRIVGDVLNCATANWDKLEPHWNAQIRYATAEGLDVRQFWTAKTENQARRKPRKRKR